jgi:cytochrome c biogenesis protein CcmG, thiol:disulfide interchange protein DsbE
MSEEREGEALATSDEGSDLASPTVLRRAGLLAKRHKIATATGAVFAAAIVVVSLLTTQSGPAARTYPVAPPFTLAALGAPGQHIALSQYAGKPVIVNFWASWCEPCQQETPFLARWYKAQHGRVNLVGLDENDSTASALKFAHAKGVSYPIGVDPAPALATAGAYGVVALPQTFFLNARHRIVDRIYGAVTQADLAAGVRLMDASS